MTVSVASAFASNEVHPPGRHGKRVVRQTSGPQAQSGCELLVLRRFCLFTALISAKPCDDVCVVHSSVDGIACLAVRWRPEDCSSSRPNSSSDFSRNAARSVA